MKYFAILKDSFREALDSWVIYVMFGLSTLVILFVATMTFEPGDPNSFLIGIGQGRIDLPQPPDSLPPVDPELEYAYVRFHGVKSVIGDKDSMHAERVVYYAVRVTGRETNKPKQVDPQKVLTFFTERLKRLEEMEVITLGEVKLVDAKTVLAAKLPEPQGPPEEPPKTKVKAPVPVDELAMMEHDVYLQAEIGPAGSTRRMWPHRLGIFFGAVQLAENARLGLTLLIIGATVFQIGAWVAILTGIVITAFFIPNMLRKGTVDLLLVKPIHRPALLFYKYLGGLTFIFLNTLLAIGGMWLVLGLRSGIWAHGFLVIILGITCYFAILYAVSALFGVMTQSAIVSILVTCGAWALFFVVGVLNRYFEEERLRNIAYNERYPDKPIERHENAFHVIVRGMHAVMPRTRDLTELMAGRLYADFLSPAVAAKVPPTRSEIKWGESIAVSLGFIAVMLGLACWWFATRDY